MASTRSRYLPNSDGEDEGIVRRQRVVCVRILGGKNFIFIAAKLSLCNNAPDIFSAIQTTLPSQKIHFSETGLSLTVLSMRQTTPTGSKP